MKIKYLVAASIVSVAAATAVPQAAYAQQITSGIEGTVTDADGMALDGATVTITDTRTGASRTQMTDDGGSFRFGSLTSGGPYTVTVTASGYEGQSVEEQYLNISGNTAYSFALTSGAAANTIVVTAARAGAQQLAVGPGWKASRRSPATFATSSASTRASALTAPTKWTASPAWVATTVRIPSPLTVSCRLTCSA